MKKYFYFLSKKYIDYIYLYFVFDVILNIISYNNEIQFILFIWSIFFFYGFSTEFFKK